MWQRRIGAVGRWTLLTLTVMLVVAWVGSRWWYVAWRRPGRWHVGVADGRLAVMRTAPVPESSSMADWGTPVVLSGSYWSAEYITWPRGLVWWFEHEAHGNEEWVSVPLWSVAAVTGAASALAWRSQLRAVTSQGRADVRRKRGACVSCGYDRRGLAATAACPECGLIPTA